MFQSFNALHLSPRTKLRGWCFKRFAPISIMCLLGTRAEKWCIKRETPRRWKDECGTEGRWYGTWACRSSISILASFARRHARRLVEWADAMPFLRGTTRCMVNHHMPKVLVSLITKRMNG